jgi:hypothetical protein
MVWCRGLACADVLALFRFLTSSRSAARCVTTDAWFNVVRATATFSC